MYFHLVVCEIHSPSSRILLFSFVLPQISSYLLSLDVLVEPGSPFAPCSPTATSSFTLQLSDAIGAASSNISVGCKDMPAALAASSSSRRKVLISLKSPKGEQEDMVQAEEGGGRSRILTMAGEKSTLGGSRQRSQRLLLQVRWPSDGGPACTAGLREAHREGERSRIGGGRILKPLAR